jgi:uncharacterized protein with FMN-binding domain
MNQSSVARIIVIVALILVGGGALTYALIGHKSTSQTPAAVATAVPATTDTTATSTPATASSGTASASTGTPSSTYKDGTYSATGSYISPGGNEKIGVTVTLKNDVITAASVTPEPVSSMGQHFQGIFAANFQPLVVGKDISSVHLTTVSGSSLTPGGFDNALAQIKAEAKA